MLPLRLSDCCVLHGFQSPTHLRQRLQPVHQGSIIAGNAAGQQRDHQNQVQLEEMRNLEPKLVCIWDDFCQRSTDNTFVLHVEWIAAADEPTSLLRANSLPYTHALPARVVRLLCDIGRGRDARRPTRHRTATETESERRRASDQRLGIAWLSTLSNAGAPYSRATSGDCRPQAAQLG